MISTPIELHQFTIPIQTEQDLKDFLWLSWGVRIPDVQVCPHHTTPWRAFADAYFAKSPVSVWKGSRGFGGKTFMLSCLGLTEACTLKANVNILGGSGAQSERVHEYHRDRFWTYEDAPKQLLLNDPSQYESKLVWGNKIEALMASQASVRGPHPQRLRLDEVDEMKLAILDAAQGQPMMGDTGIAVQTVMSSTHQYSNGTMTEILKRASLRGWPVYEWCYKETSNPIDGWLSQAEIESKRTVVTDQMWETEYDLQTPQAGSHAINPASVKAMFLTALGEYAGAVGEYIEIEEPNDNYWYFTGADWARKDNFTDIFTWRWKPGDVRYRCVAYERMNRLPWPHMIGRFITRLRRFGGWAAHDMTGIGDVVDAYLPAMRQTITPDGSVVFESNDEYICGVILTGKPRATILSQYILAIEHGQLESPMIKAVYDEHATASVDALFGEKHPPDSIIASALAMFAVGWQAAKRKPNDENRDEGVRVSPV